MSTRRAVAGVLKLSLTALALGALLSPAAALGASGQGTLRGTVPLARMNVVLMAAQPGGGEPVTLGRTRSGRGGAFTIGYRGATPGAVKYLLATRPGGGAEAGFPVPGNSYRLAAALGAGRVPRRAAVNERTTVAIGYAMAQFIDGGRVAGKNPGLRNAAAMTRNLVRRRDGGLARVIRFFPNGGSTSTLATFDSLANLVASCRAQGRRCATLLKLAGVPGAGAAGDTLAAVTDIARYPWHNSRALFKLSLRARGRYTPALAPGERPDAWTLALRFEGSPPGLDGPGNIAVDRQGSLWVINNYKYSRRVHQPACASEKLFRFTPTGQTYPGSPYTGGGINGAGFGVTLDPFNHVWVGNFGFEGRGCETPAPHTSVSEYTITGEPLSPGLRRFKVEFPSKSGNYKFFQKGGWEQGDIFWPQATVSDRRGNIWVANCGNESLTRFPEGNPELAENLPQSLITRGTRAGFERPFGAAVSTGGRVFVTGNESASVAELGPNGEPIRMITGGGLHRPQGVASDSRGNIWVTNSTWVVAPCVGQFHPQGGPSQGGTVTLIKSNGEVAPGNPIRGGGVRIPWGVAIDGADNVWVANFGGRRLSELCGTRPENCPAGKQRVGASIAPRKTGYGFDGLGRDTGIAVDPSGNVWLANNWRKIPIQTNPGDYQIVAYLGIAAPVKTPLIGPPRQP
ncbi:MAG: hypothetical protein ACM3JL_01350 [Nitrososphaerota archaeon]